MKFKTHALGAQNLIFFPNSLQMLFMSFSIKTLKTFYIQLINWIFSIAADLIVLDYWILARNKLCISSE